MYVFDLEADNLLDSLTTIHVLCVFDTETYAMQTLRGHDTIGDFIRENFQDGPKVKPLIGHNIIGYDIPALQKIYPWFKPHKQVFDTLVASRLVFPPGDGSPLVDEDMKRKEKGSLPGGLIGSHSLEAWGYRLGNYKGDFKGPWTEQEVYEKAYDEARFDVHDGCGSEGREDSLLAQDMAEEAVQTWCDTMDEYCRQDVRVTYDLYRHILKEEPSEEALKLEHDVQWIIQRQIRRGVEFDVRKAELLYVKLLDKKMEHEDKLKATFGCWYERDGKEVFTPKSDNTRLGYTAGAPLSKVKLVEFNPGSRQHIAKRLTALYGWKPKEVTESGQAKIDEKVLSKLKYPTVPLIMEYLMIEKRLGQLKDGKNGWLGLVTPEGRIHGNVNSNGAVTGRMTHSSPNLAQVPSSGAPYGHDCRELFKVSPGHVMVGCDASGLELRMLAHFMGRYDEGSYAKVVVDGDVHWVNTQAMGLIGPDVKRNKDEETAEGQLHKELRDNAKTFIYAFLYGAGDAKIGSIIKGSADAGKRLKEKFLKGLPALGALKDAVEQGTKKGYIYGLDKRKLHIRSAHAALNTLLQSAGALVMKKALVILDETLQTKGLVPGVDYEVVLSVHDEYQLEVRKQYSQLVGETAVWAIQQAGIHFKLRCPLDGEFKVGANWSETH